MEATRRAPRRCWGLIPGGFRLARMRDTATLFPAAAASASATRTTCPPPSCTRPSTSTISCVHTLPVACSPPSCDAMASRLSSEAHLPFRSVGQLMGRN
eukprot:scaffold544_cov320-Pavlova_lutheri.AAC.66